MTKKTNGSRAASGGGKAANGNYAVGYARPPKETQFKPGRSGNLKGRPKGAKNEATMLREMLHERIDIQQGGRSRKVPSLQVMLLKCRNAALGGDLKALAFLLNRYRLIAGVEPDTDALLDQDGRQILEDYKAELEAELETKKE